jgi:hypothetical protein
MDGWSIIISLPLPLPKMPFVPDPRYDNTNDRQYKVHEQIREDVSMTQRAPYPQQHEINLPRHKMIAK